MSNCLFHLRTNHLIKLTLHLHPPLRRANLELELDWRLGSHKRRVSRKALITWYQDPSNWPPAGTFTGNCLVSRVGEVQTSMSAFGALVDDSYTNGCSWAVGTNNEGAGAASEIIVVLWSVGRAAKRKGVVC